MEAAVRALDRAGLQLVCLFDDFDTVTGSAAFGLELYGSLESLARAHHVAYVTTSRRRLRNW